MAAFSYELHHPNSFHVDSLFLPKMSAFLEEPNNSTTVPICISQLNQVAECPVNMIVHETSYKINEPCVTNNKSSSSILEMDSCSDTHKMERVTTSMDRKRKNSEGSSSMTSAQSKSVREADREKKQTKRNGNVNKEKKATEGPIGYVHVRARRGQATDSHSLAERVRREKISERMKILQAIVPGCDKVGGKALMLDEIINYVQSLQNQVEFLSMKLSSLNPIYYDLGAELDDQSLSDLGAYTNVGYPLRDISSSVIFQRFHCPNPISQVNGELVWGADEQGHELINQSGASNLSSFH